MDRKTVVTFSGPVEVPGVGAQVLPAGTYIFKVLDSLSDRHIVQILNRNETYVYTTILAIPNFRLKATDKTVITFRERPVGQCRTENQPNIACVGNPTRDGQEQRSGPTPAPTYARDTGRNPLPT